MLIQNIDTKKTLPINEIVLDGGKNNYFLICNPHELLELQPIFNFDETTVIDCLNFDDRIRYTSFNNYDYISFVYFWLENENVELHEINLYISLNYVVFVIPEVSKNKAFDNSICKILEIFQTAPPGTLGINKMYYHIFDIIISDFSDTMEKIEDNIHDIENLMQKKANNAHFVMLNKVKSNIYTVKKQIRPLLYVGDQFIVNENKIIKPEYIHFFRTVDIRMNKLYDFVVSLGEYANQAQYSYDSKITMETNEIVSKLTILTVFIGPLTIITGVYGMNFKYMPETEWAFGYPMVLAIMALYSLTAFLLLKYKKWL